MNGHVYLTKESNGIGLQETINIACSENEIEIALSEDGFIVTYNQGNRCYTIEYNPDFVIRSKNIEDGTFSTIMENGDRVIVMPFGGGTLPEYGDDFDEMVLKA